jgi:hypothetical protein
LTESQRLEAERRLRELERRLEEDLRDPSDVVSWEELQERLKAARRAR